MKEPAKTKDIMFKDVKIGQNFWIYGHAYRKDGEDKAFWYEGNSTAKCEPDNWVSVEEA